MSKIFVYLSKRDGFSTAEYALGIAVVGAAIAACASFMGSLIVGSADVVSGAADCIRFHSHITTC
jgi:hypothetical protein